MSSMNTNRQNIPKAPPAPAMKPAAARPAPGAPKPGMAKPAPGRPLPKPPAAPKAPGLKPGFDQKNYSEMTKNARPPGGTMRPAPPKK